MDEKGFERRLIKKLRDAGFWANHMDTGITGFPDILAMKDEKATLIEVKGANRSMALRSLMERSQPAFFATLAKAGFTRCLVAVCGDTTVELFRPEDIIGLVLDDETAKITDMGAVFSGDYQCAAWYISMYHEGRK